MSIPDGVLERFAGYVQHMVNEINKDPRNKGDKLLCVFAGAVVRDGDPTGAAFAVAANCNVEGIRAAWQAIAMKVAELEATEREESATRS